MQTWFDGRCRGSSLVRYKCHAAILVVRLMTLVTFGVVRHAQMPRPEAELAKRLAHIGEVGAKEANGVVPLVSVIAETGTPSSASKGAVGRNQFARHARIP